MKLVRFFSIVLFLHVLIPANAFAGSTGTIVGTVTSAEKKTGVAGAIVVAKSLSGTLRAVTDEKGSFTIPSVLTDTYTISVSAKGYSPASIAGINVFADQDERVSLVLTRELRTISVVRARSSTSAFQPQQTVDKYTLSTAGIEQFLGKTFNTDQTKLLRALPSVTIDRSGTPLIRGGFSYQTAFEFEGIDYTEPNASVMNRFQNTGNGGLLNGIGAIEIIPGGGDATHGNTGTGLVALTAKRGTLPASGTFDAEMGSFGARQIGTEFGVAGSHFSNYFSFISEYQPNQYGPGNTDPRTIGASAITQDPNANSNVRAHFGSPFTSAFFNTASTTSRDFIDNLVFKFGKNEHESLQFFLQSQSISQVLNYGGIAGLKVVNPGAYLFQPEQYGWDKRFFSSYASEMNFAKLIATPFPYGTPGGALDAPGTAQSPFVAYKLEFGDTLDPRTSLTARVYHTYNSQSLLEPDQGLYYTSSGGERSGVSSDITRLLGEKNSLRVGGKFEFAKPFGTRNDYVDYMAAYTGGVRSNFGNDYQIAVASPASVVPDFIAPQNYFIGANGTTGTAGCMNAQPLAGSARPFFTNYVPCGYVASFFPNGNIPRLPVESEVPTAQQQVYALYLQDTYAPNSRLRALLGVRLDGYNFLIPDDPAAPPSIDGIRHQRQYEPHVGISYTLTKHDVLRANFGRTLAIPLASFLGEGIDRNAFSAFDKIPSYDNTRGLFDPNRPNATRATYCGVGSATNTLFLKNLVVGNQPCASYADQLYWLVRNYRYGLQEQLTYPLRGSTFTNYDISYSHEFKDGTAFKITPFYRRGYDIVEHTRSLLGFDKLNEIPILSPDLVSNLGQQTATGVEFFLSKPRDLGLSYELSATYVNQFGNDPPGTYLPTASLQMGLLYHSAYLAPLQSTLGLTYKSRSGWQFNPVFTYRSGYPYGQGVNTAFTIDGKPVFAPLTDAIVGGANGPLVAPALVDPQNPGSILNPNIVAYRGTEAPNSGPGSLRSNPSLITDVTVKYTPPGTAITWGLSVDNLFNEIADVPVPNYWQMNIPIATGRTYHVPGQLGNPKDPSAGLPNAVGSTSHPYIVFPNQTPLSYRFFVQVKL